MTTWTRGSDAVWEKDVLLVRIYCAANYEWIPARHVSPVTVFTINQQHFLKEKTHCLHQFVTAEDEKMIRFSNSDTQAIIRRQLNQSWSTNHTVALNKLLSTKWTEVPRCETDDQWSKQLIDPGGWEGWIQHMKETLGPPVRLDGWRKTSFFPCFLMSVLHCMTQQICILQL